MRFHILLPILISTSTLWSTLTQAQNDDNNALLCEFFPHLCVVTETPSINPTSSQAPTESPSVSQIPTSEPSMSPTDQPSSTPSSSPTAQPSLTPSSSPTDMPSLVPTNSPSISSSPSSTPSTTPTALPTTSASPTNKPSFEPSLQPSSTPSISPSDSPSVSSFPSSAPSMKPTMTAKPSSFPSTEPSNIPTFKPSESPTLSTSPSSTPSSNPTYDPSSIPSESPSVSSHPSLEPSTNPTDIPSTSPTSSPSSTPTTQPSSEPSNEPTDSPSSTPTSVPTWGERPNLIMILTDEHSIRTLGCYRDVLRGEQKHVWGDGIEVETPNIDRLASEGALFTNFYTVAPLCTPSRASFMSGLYPQNTGGSQYNHGRMDDDITTFADVLQNQRDYFTGYFGKWHLNGHEKPGWSNDERKFGFEDTKYQYNRGHWKYLDEINGEMRAFDFNQQHRFNGREDKHFTTDYLFDRSIEFMDKAKERDQPFAYVLSIPDPHAPNQVRQPYEDMYKHMHFNLPQSAKRAVQKNPASPMWNFHEHMGVRLSDAEEYLQEYEDTKRYQNHLQQYFGMVKCIDDNVGKLLDYLEDKGIDNETIVVFTSDHGDLLGEHGKLNKGRPYRTSAGIPFIVRYPDKVPQNKVVNSALSSVDFAPSILSLMNVKDHDVEFDGKDFSQEVTNHEQMDTNYGRTKYVFDPNIDAIWAAAINRQYRLVVSRSDAPWLFNLNVDPFEIVNFFDDPEHAKIRQVLLDDLYTAMETYNIPLKHATRYIWWSTPACLDSNDSIEVNSESYTCADIGRSLSYDKCNEEVFKDHCSVTCNSCCEDSAGEMWVDGSLYFCSQLKNKCANKIKVQKFCPLTCGTCTLNDNMQSIFN